MTQKHYFEHPFTFSDFPETIFLMSNGGALAYGRCLLIIEILGRNENKLDLSNKVHRFTLCQKLELKNEELDAFVDWIIESGLFSRVDNILSSKVVVEAIEKITAKSEKARESASKRWDKNSDSCDSMRTHTNAYEQKKVNANACERIESDANGCDSMRGHAIRLEKKRKEEIRKEENNKKENKKEKEISLFSDEDPSLSSSTSEEKKPKEIKEPIEKKIPEAVSKIVNQYNDILSGLRPEAEIISDKRIDLIQRLVRKHGETKIIKAFEKVAISDFLLNKIEDSPFNGCDLDWIINENNFAKILEGKYDNGRYRRAGPPPSLAETTLKKAKEEAMLKDAQEASLIGGEIVYDTIGNDRPFDHHGDVNSGMAK